MAHEPAAHERNAIRYVACPLELSSDWFAVGESEHVVEVWSLVERRLISAFTTVMDFGGRRLALSGGEQPVVVAGAYYRYGVCGYDARSGETSWERKDLKHVQSLTPLPRGHIAAGFEDKSLQVLSATTGETLNKLRGLWDLHPSAYHHRTALGFAWNKSFGLFDFESGKQLWKEPLLSFAIIDAALAPDAIAVSEAGGPVRCLDYGGGERWRWAPPSGEHVYRLTWNQALERFCGVLHPYERTRARALLVFGERGAVDSAVEIPDAWDYGFMPGGEKLIVGTPDAAKHAPVGGEVLTVPDAHIDWRFRREPLVSL